MSASMSLRPSHPARHTRLADFDLLRAAMSLALVACAFYLTLCAGLYFWQRKIIFLTTAERPVPALAGVPDVEVWTIRTEDGLDLNAWFQPAAAADHPVVLFFHGNSGHIGHRAPRIPRLAAAGMGVLMLEYRGFGGNPGAPSEEGLARDARAAHAALRAHGIDAARIVLWGESLGTAVAVRLATEVRAAALVLEAPFTSMADIARMRYRVVPVDPLLKDRFDSASRIAAVDTPLLVIHGQHDEMIPFAMGSRLFAAATMADRQFWTAAGAGHNDLAEHGAIEYAIAFVTDRTTHRHLAQR